MTAHFDEFEEEMTSRSLERAYDYVDEHRIGGLEEVSAGLFHAEVHGSELYDVDIDFVATISCSHPAPAPTTMTDTASILVRCS